MTRRSWVSISVGVGLVLLIVLVDKAEDVLAHVEYPMDVWRMDLDDALANIGLFLGGLGAFLVVFKTAKDAHKKADQVGERVNGGLKKLAEQAIKDELHVADLEQGLYRRVDALEQRIEVYEVREREWVEEKAQLRKDRLALRGWLDRRLEED